MHTIAQARILDWVDRNPIGKQPDFHQKQNASCGRKSQENPLLMREMPYGGEV
jgi:hypothetical protein